MFAGRTACSAICPHRAAAAFSALAATAALLCRGCLLQLRRRLAQSGQFPHEIGLFLGYPPCDVLGFLHDAGRHSKLSGYWQVYGDAQAALALFAKYKNADVYARCHANGTSIWQLTVAA